MSATHSSIGFFTGVKRKQLAVFFSILMFSCCQSPAVRQLTLTYNEYNGNNALLRKDAATQVFKPIKNDEFLLTITSLDGYKQALIEKDINGRIYWKCDTVFLLSHSIYPSDQTYSCFSASPFLNQRIKLNGAKTYKIRNRDYHVYSFNESTGSDADEATYYLKGLGFICYYDLETKNYFFLSKITGKNSMSGIPIELLKEHLINDTSFFAKYRFQDTLHVKFPPPVKQ